MLVLFLMNFAVILTSYLVVKYFFYFKSAIDYLLTIFVFYFTQIVLSLLFLGLSGRINSVNALIVNVFLLILVFAIIKFSKTRPKDNLGLKFTSLLASVNFGKVEILCLAFILGFALVKVYKNMVNPPFGWDNLSYHFTYPVEWLKAGDLRMSIGVSGDFSVSYYPINGSLLFLWFILPLRNVFLADLAQAPFFVIAFLALFSLGRKLNLSNQYALFAAALFSLIPNYFKQLQIAYIDIMVAALFFIVLNYLFLLNKEKSARHIILYSLTLGLIIGTKTTALPQASLLILSLAYLCFRGVRFKKSIFLFLLAMFFIFLTGGFSYIRNLIQTGNPFFPLTAKLFGKVVFQGLADITMYKTGIRPGDHSLVKILFSEGLGGQTIIFVLPAVILGLPVALWKRRKELDFTLAYFLILPFLIALVFKFILPLPNLRYIYVLFGVSLLVSFYLADTLKIPKWLIKTLVALCVIGSASELAKRSELVYAFIVSFFLLFTLSFIIDILKTKRLTRYAFGIAVVIFFLLVLLERDYVKNEYPRYLNSIKDTGFWPDAARAWVWLNENTSGNNIAYIGRPATFPLYGTNFKNNVYYVSVNEVEPAMVHNFAHSNYVFGYDKEGRAFRNFESPGNYRGGANYDVWLRNLVNKNTDYFFVYKENATANEDYPMEDGWAKSHSNKFDLVYDYGDIHIYKLRR